MENTLPHIFDYEKAIFDRQKLEDDMASLYLEKNLYYFKIQEILRSKSRTEYYFCEGLFLCFFLYPEWWIINTK